MTVGGGRTKFPRQGNGRQNMEESGKEVEGKWKESGRKESRCSWLRIAVWIGGYQEREENREKGRGAEREGKRREKQTREVQKVHVPKDSEQEVSFPI